MCRPVWDTVGLMRRAGTSRWDVLLPAGAAVVAAMIVWLGVTAAASMRERAVMALDGRVLRLSHDAEREIRDRGLEAVEGVLSALLTRESGVVRGLTLQRADGTAVATVGEARAPFREVQLFVGPTAWGGTPGGGGRSASAPSRGRGRGRLLLFVAVDADVARAPLSSRLLVPATVAVGCLLIAISAIGGKLLVREELRVVEEAEQRRLVSLGRAGAGLAHQLRTPLATIKGSCQLLAEDAPDSHAAKRLQTALEQCERMERLLGQLLDYTRPPQREPEDVAVLRLLEEVAAGRPGVVVTSAEGAVRVDPEHLRQVLENLVDNAVKAGAGETVELSSSSSKAHVQIRVADRGPGPGDDPESLFEPYVTTRADGIGLGLPIARALVEANGGTITLGERSGGGCEASLILPAARGAG